MESIHLSAAPGFILTIMIGSILLQKSCSWGPAKPRAWLAKKIWSIALAIRGGHMEDANRSQAL